MIAILSIFNQNYSIILKRYRAHINTLIHIQPNKFLSVLNMFEFLNPIKKIDIIIFSDDFMNDAIKNSSFELSEHYDNIMNRLSFILKKNKILCKSSSLLMDSILMNDYYF